MNDNIFFDTKLNQNVAQLKCFIRNDKIEEKIDNELCYSKGLIGLETYSIKIFIDRLNQHISSYNSDSFGKTDLHYFLQHLRNINDNEINRLPFHLQDYIRNLKDYISNLKITLNIPNISNLRYPIHSFSKKLIKILIQENFNLDAIIARSKTTIHKKPYGIFIRTRNINYIYLERNINLKDDLNGQPTCIIFNKDIGKDLIITDLVSLEGIIEIISFKNIDEITFYNKSKIAQTHIKTYYDINRYLKELQKDSYIIKLLDRIYDIQSLLLDLESELSLQTYFNEHKIKSTIKLLQHKNRHLIMDLKELLLNDGFSHKLESVSRNLEQLYTEHLSYSQLDNHIDHSLSTIKKNKFLYRTREKGGIFGEENLSSILKSLLELRLTPKRVHVTQEEINGTGFSDIEIKNGINTISIIESKLIKDYSKNNIDRVFAKGLDQIYNRYSRTIYISVEMPPRLYLILFCVDPDWKDIRNKINNTLDTYCLRNSINVSFLEKRKEDVLSIRMIQEHNNFRSFSLDIDIIICSLENHVDIDRLIQKTYNPKKQRNK